MSVCSYCGREFGELPFKCRHCGKTFCPQHNIPESHDCPKFNPGKPWYGRGADYTPPVRGRDRVSVVRAQPVRRGFIRRVDDSFPGGWFGVALSLMALAVIILSLT